MILGKIALTPALSRRERGNYRQSVYSLNALVLLKDGMRFSLSPRERAGVGCHTTSNSINTDNRVTMNIGQNPVQLRVCARTVRQGKLADIHA